MPGCSNGAGNALGPEQHHGDEQETEIQHPGIGHGADHIARNQEQEHADHRSPETDEATADQRHHHHIAGLMQAHHIGKSRELRHREQPAGKPRNRRRQRKDRRLVEPDIVAEMRGAGFALLDGRDDAAIGRMHQPPQSDDSEGEDDENEIVERHIAGEIERRKPKIGRQPRDLQQPVLAAGDLVRLDRECPEYLAESDRHEGIVDAAPVRDEQRDQRSGQSRDNERRGQTYPEIGDDIELTKAEGVGTDSEIGAVTERRQSGRTKHEIERKRVERPDQDFDAEIRIEPDARDP